jgi:hypothetical protein
MGVQLSPPSLCTRYSGAQNLGFICMLGVSAKNKLRSDSFDTFSYETNHELHKFPRMNATHFVAFIC